MTRKNKSLGRQIIEGLEAAVTYQGGQRSGARVTQVLLTARGGEVEPAPLSRKEGIVKLRARLHLSQALFAQALNVSPETVRAWEQSKRTPDGAALRLLQIAERHPEVILENVRRRTA